MNFNALMSFVLNDRIIKNAEREGVELSKSDKNMARLLPMMGGGAAMANMTPMMVEQKVAKKRATSVSNWKNEASQAKAKVKEAERLEIKLFDDLSDLFQKGALNGENIKGVIPLKFHEKFQSSSSLTNKSSGNTIRVNKNNTSVNQYDGPVLKRLYEAYRVQIVNTKVNVKLFDLVKNGQFFSKSFQIVEGVDSKAAKKIRSMGISSFNELDTTIIRNTNDVFTAIQVVDKKKIDSITKQVRFLAEGRYESFLKEAYNLQ